MEIYSHLDNTPPEIKEAHELYLEMLNNARKYEKLASLALADEVNIIKQSFDYKLSWINNICDKAILWIKMLEFEKEGSQKIDHRKHYEEEDCYKSIVDFIEGMIGTTIDLYDISYGYENCTQNFKFNTNQLPFKYTFELKVPIRDSLKVSNIEYAAWGKLSLSKKLDDGMWDPLIFSYSQDDIHKAYIKAITPIPV